MIFAYYQYEPNRGPVFFFPPCCERGQSPSNWDTVLYFVQSGNYNIISIMIAEIAIKLKLITDITISLLRNSLNTNQSSHNSQILLENARKRTLGE